MAKTTVIACLALAVILAAAACAAVEEDRADAGFLPENPFVEVNRRMLSACGSSQKVWQNNCNTAINVCNTCCCNGNVFHDNDGCQHCCDNPSHKYCLGGCRAYVLSR